MADKTDMSLDDIIAMNNGDDGRSRGRSVTRGGARRGTGSPRGRGRGAGSPRGGRGRRGDGGRVQKPRPGLFRSQRRLNDDALREHDTYNGGRGKPQGSRQHTSGDNTDARLIVSNLHPVVNDEDIHELFAECGPLKRSSVNYNKSGKSLGTAEVVFERPSDAVEAMKRYNKVPLDGLPLQIDLIGGPGDVNDSSRNSARRQTNRSQYKDQDRPGRRGDGLGGGRGRGGRNERKVDTQRNERKEIGSQLDAGAGGMLTLNGLEVFGI